MATDRFDIVVRVQGTNQVNRKIKSIGTSANSTRKILALMRAALVIIASIQVIAGFTRLIDVFTEMRNKLRLLSDDTKVLATLQTNLFRIAQETRTSFETLGDVFFKITRSTLRMRLSFGELLDITKVLAQTIAISGVATETANAALIQFGQGLSSGALAGEELRSVSENLPELARIIGKEFGIAAGQLIAFNKANKNIFTTERLIKAVVAAIPELGDIFAKTQVTISQGFTRVNNALVFFLGGVNDATGASAFLADGLTKIANNIDKVVFGLLVLGGVVVFNFLVGQVLGLIGVMSRLTTLVGVGVVGAFKLLAGSLRIVIVLFNILKFAILGNPLFIIGALAIGLIVGAIFLFRDELTRLVKGLGGVNGIINKVIATIGAFVSIMKIIAVGAVNFFIDRLNFLILTTNLIIRQLNKVIGVLKVIGSALATAALGIVDFFVTVTGPLIEPIKQAIDDINEAFDTLIDKLRSIRDKLAPIFTDITNGIKDLDKGLTDTLLQIPGVKLITDKARGLAESISNAFKDTTIPEIGTVGLIENTEGTLDQVVKIFKDKFSEIEKSDPAGAIQARFEELLDFLKKFTKDGATSLDELLKLFPKGAGEGKNLTAELNKELNAIAAIIRGLSPLAEARARMIKVNKALSNARKAGINVLKIFGLTEDEIIRRTIRNQLGAGNAVAILAEKTELLNKARKDGNITAVEEIRLLRDARIAALRLDESFSGQLTLTLLEFQKELSNVGDLAGNVIVNAFGSAEDAIVKFVTTGKLEFSSLINSILTDITRLAVRSAITVPLANLLGIGAPGGGFFGNILGAFAPAVTGGGGGGIGGGGGGGIPGLRTGGQFTVGGAGGADSQLVAFKATPGEEVTVTRPDQRPTGVEDISGRPIQIFLNISTPDLESFGKARDQLMNEAFVAASRANRRNS